ncbi:Ceramidase [Roseivivax halotolerans]|uniref:Ceramidase n=1 Tax=Roseivivax halotolerans TaxID=93684 RepID=A0A1I5WK93_9RHOB|nr:ceramidase domain-containing protein [Roseivivax halotolerans]SFQ19988.1 Ceramidase [Roseivivax halotolerans]
MDWRTYIDGYCERLEPGLWAEPINALTNLAFLIVAALLWRPSRGVPVARALVLILGLIGIGSGLFHTFAEPWAGLADVLPIAVYVALYIFAANRDYLGFGTWAALGITALEFAAIAAVGSSPVFAWLGGSGAYAPIPCIIALYALILARSAPATARGLAIGAALLALSITFRALDAPLCGTLPFGTHFLWHILNALMLGHMIRVYLARIAEARLAGRADGR